MTALLRQLQLDGAVGYWPLNDTGAPAADWSGNARSASQGNAALTWGQPGPAGARAVQTGANKFLTVASASAFSARDFSAEVWVNGSDTGGVWFAAYPWTGATNWQWSFGIDAGLGVFFGTGRTGDGDWFRYGKTGSGNMPPTTRWVHIAASYDNTSGDVVITYDGVPQSITYGGAGGTRMGAASVPLQIGAYNSTYQSAGDAWQGDMAHAAYFGSVLSVDRFKSHREAALRAGVVVG